MIINANVTTEIAEYYKNYDISAVVDALLDMYDFTNLPQCTIKRDPSNRRELKINVTNTYYLSLYDSLGAHSRKLSLGRLLEFGYSMDVLALPRFKNLLVEQKPDESYTLIDRAYRALVAAKQYDDSPELAKIVEVVYSYREVKKK
jgi:hypothetical protein